MNKSASFPGGNIGGNARYLLLDTNILSRIETGGIGLRVAASLDAFASENGGWDPVISIISAFEIMNEIPYGKEAGTLDLINQFPIFNTNEHIYMTAAQLGCSYKRYFQEIRCSDKIPEHGDKILAATALITDSIICTANMRDYPAPFFKELFREHVTHESQKASVCLTMYFMEPQATFILDYHEKRIPKRR